MGLLRDTERQQLIDLLIRLPNSTSLDTRRILLTCLPETVAPHIPDSTVPFTHISMIVETLDQEGMQLHDGTWLLTRLIEKAIWMTPAALKLHLDLIKFYDQVRLRQDVSQADTTPEAIMREGAGPYEVEEWFARFRKVCNAVCRMVTPSGKAGTGFLVAPGLVLTNWHVIENEADDPPRMAQTQAQFDVRRNSESKVIAAGTVYRLTSQKPLASSPFAELDFALLRVEGQPGNDRAMDGQPRGWLIPSERPLEAGEPLMIVQHPGGTPMKIALDRVIRAEGRRVHYTTNTAPGSSGSPCLDRNWNLVALHHAAVEGAFNIGVVMAEIANQADVRAYLQQPMRQSEPSAELHTPSGTDKATHNEVPQPARAAALSRTPAQKTPAPAPYREQTPLADSSSGSRDTPSARPEQQSKPRMRTDLPARERCGALVVGVSVEGQRAERYPDIAGSARFLHQEWQTLRIIKPEDAVLLTGKDAAMRQIAAALARFEHEVFASVFVVLVGRNIVEGAKMVLYPQGEELDLNQVLDQLDRIADRGTGVCCVLDFNTSSYIVNRLLQQRRGVAVITWRSMRTDKPLAGYVARMLEHLSQAAHERTQTSADLASAVAHDPDHELFTYVAPVHQVVIVPKIERAE